jgi:hypothetical protein
MALLRGEAGSALTQFKAAAEQNPAYVADFTPLQEGIWTYVGRAYYETGDLGQARAALERSLTLNPKDFVARLYLGMTFIRLQEEKKTRKGLSLNDVLFALREGVEPKRMATLIGEKGIDFDLTVEAENTLRGAGADNELIRRIKTLRSESVAQKASLPTREQGVKELEVSLQACLHWLENFTATTSEGKYWDPGARIRSRITSALDQTSRKETKSEDLLASGEWIGRELEEEVDRARRQEQRDTAPGVMF